MLFLNAESAGGSRTSGASGVVARAVSCLLLLTGCSSTDAALAPAAEASSPIGADAGDGGDAAVIEPKEELCTLSGPPKETMGETLVHADEFNGTSVDTTKWSLISHKRGSDNVLNRMSPDNAVVRDGSLFIVASETTNDPDFKYHAALLDSLGKFARTYGKVEFRARFPYQAGVWFALWGRPWFQSFPEIDIEILNKGSVGHSQLYFVNHWAPPPAPPDERRSFTMLDDVDLTKFHTFTVLWKPALLEWAIDGVPKMRSIVRGVPTDPVYWMINSFVGGWAEAPKETTKFPVTFEVDYMRVYRVDGLVGDPLVKIANPEKKYTQKDYLEVAVANFDEVCAHVELYDGNKLAWTTAKAPYRFKLSHVGTGQRHLTVVATDGVRRTTTAIDADIE